MIRVILIGALLLSLPQAPAQTGFPDLQIEGGDEGEALDRSIEGAAFTLAVEVFSVPMARAAEMRRGGQSDLEKYDDLLKGVATGEVGQVRLYEVRGMAEEPLSVAEVREYIYPIGFDPPRVQGLPAKLPPDFQEVDRLIMPAMPVDFQKQDLGDWVEGTLRPNPKVAGEWTGSLSYRHVSLKRQLEWGEDEAKIKLPEFREQKVEAAVKLTAGGTSLLGSFSDPAPEAEKKASLWVIFVSLAALDEDLN
jgi:hypothetical protein